MSKNWTPNPERQKTPNPERPKINLNPERYKIYLLLDLYFPPLHPKGAQTTSNLQYPPKCWYDISNTNNLLNLQIFPNVGHNISKTNSYEGCTDNLQLIYVPPSVGMIYPIPTCIFNLQILPKCGQNIFNSILYIYFPPLHPKGAQTISNLYITPNIGTI